MNLPPIDTLTLQDARDEVQRLRKRLLSASLLIDECYEAFAEYEDTHDGDEGRPIANAAMQARTAIGEWRGSRV